MANKGSYLTVGQYLQSNDYLVSANGQFVAFLQNDQYARSFVLYHVISSSSWSYPYWNDYTAPPTPTVSPLFALLRDDGKFVIYDGGDPTHLNSNAATWTAGAGAVTAANYLLILQDDGNLALCYGSDPAHITGTYWTACQTPAGLSTLYELVSVNSGKVLDVSGGSQADVTPIIQYTYYGQTNQLWYFETVKMANGNNAIKIVNVNSGKVLDVSGGSQADGTPIIQYTYHGGANQLWYTIALEVVNGHVAHQIVSANNNKLISVDGGSTSDGAKILQWMDNNGANQLWFLLPVPGPASLPQAYNYTLNGPESTAGTIRSGGQSRVPPLPPPD